MKMIFSIPKPKNVNSIQNQNKQNSQKSVNNHPASTMYINPFTNIFSRLQSSGPCKSCG
jgi:hypothetical protein